MPARTQRSLEVKESAQPIVHELAKQNVLSLFKEILKNQLTILSKDKYKLFSSVSGVLSDCVSIDCAKSISLDIKADEWIEKKGKNPSTMQAINKMAKKGNSEKFQRTHRFQVRLSWPIFCL